MLWFRIARNEIRLKTYRFRKRRKSFFIIIYGLFLFWAIFLGPSVIDLILPDILKIYASSLKTILHPVIEYSFMMIFIIFIAYPLLMLYRRFEIGIKDVVLSSPAKPGDILLGEFLGQLPFYLLFILGIGPLGISILAQLNPSLTFFHYLLFYLMIFSLITFGLLIGTIITNWLEHKILTRKSSSSLSSSFFLVLPFLIILVLYLFHVIFEFLDYNPSFKVFMNLFPSFWYSNIILYFVDPILVNSYFLNMWVYFILIIGIPILISYISYKKADIFYDLEKSNHLKTHIFKIEKFFIKILHKMTPNNYRILVITQFKEFIRKRENINKVLYIIALNIVFGVFLSISLDKPLLSITEFSTRYSLLIIEVLSFNYLIMLILSWMGGLTFGIFMGIYVFVNTKEIIYVYKKSVRSVKALIFSFLYNMFFIILILDLILTVIFSAIFLSDIYSSITFFLTYLGHSSIILIQAIGIQCIKPLYKERGKFIYFNIYVIALLQVLSFLLTLIIFIPSSSAYINYSIGLIFIILINFGLSFAFSLILLILGIIKLDRTE